MLEAYAYAEDEGAGGITYCPEYPAPNILGTYTGVPFYLNTVEQYDPSWNSFVTTSPSWGAFFGSAPYNCDFSVEWSDEGATLYWNDYAN
jgi:hypothetical protein